MRVLVCALLAFLPAAVASADDYLPLKTGHSWTYSLANDMEMVSTVTGFADVGGIRCASVETKVGPQITREFITSDATGVRVYRFQVGQQEITYDQPIVRLRLPFKAGESWNSTVTQGEARVTTDFKSAGRETIKTAAGTFDCIKITAAVSTGDKRWTMAAWYSDGVGLVQQEMTDQGQSMVASLKSANFLNAAATAPDHPAPATQTDRACPGCGVPLPVDAKFCPQCGQRVTASPALSPVPSAAPATARDSALTVASAPKPTDTPRPATAPEPAPNTQPATVADAPELTRFADKDGKLVVYRPREWNVEQGELFGPGSVTVMISHPAEEAAVLFIAIPLDPKVKDAIGVAQQFFPKFAEQYDRVRLTRMVASADRSRAIAELSLTEEGRAATAHVYLFHDLYGSKVIVLLAAADKWDAHHAAMSAVVANLAYAPAGVSAVLEPGRKLAQQFALPEGKLLSPAAMLADAAGKPGRRLSLAKSAAADSSLTVQTPSGWSFQGQAMQWVAYENDQTKNYGVCSVLHTIVADAAMKVNPGTVRSGYLPPAQAVSLLLRASGVCKDFEVLADLPVARAAADMNARFGAAMAAGCVVEPRLMLVKFTNTATVQVERGLFAVTTAMSPGGWYWQCALDGGWAPDREFDSYLPLYLRMAASVDVSHTWLAGRAGQPGVAMQLANRGLFASTQGLDTGVQSNRTELRERDFAAWVASQTTVGLGEWVAACEGATVTPAPSWDSQGPGPARPGKEANLVRITGQRPWTDEQAGFTDIRTECERLLGK